MQRSLFKRINLFSYLICTLFVSAFLAGCGSQGDRSVRLARIQALEIEPGNNSTAITLKGDRSFEPRVEAVDVPPSLEIRIPFALGQDIGNINKKLKLPRGGIKSIKVSNLRRKHGGLNIIIQMDRPFKFTSKQARNNFRIEIEYSGNLAKTTETGSKSKRAENTKQNKESQFLIPQVSGLKKSIDYTIGGKDVLSVIIFEEEELSKKAIRVSNDGFITFPLIGRVKVIGLTTNEVENEITRRLRKDFLVNPQITVQVTEFSSKFINVLGAVKTPGGIPLKGTITLLETIAKAGGVNIEGAGKNIIVLRQSEGKDKKVQHITIDLNRLLKEGDLSLNMPLRDKDTVFIPEADQIFVFGEVKSPGPYDLTDQTRSVVEAISKAGGLTKLAAANRTRVVRVEDGEERVIEVDVEKIMEGDRSHDQFLKPGDIIVVPEVYF
jgi:polysaccharide biosynthesis/export protein